MRKLYNKSEINFALVWIVVYTLANSFAYSLSAKVGVDFSVNAAFNVVMAVVLFCWLKKNDMFPKYGLCKTAVPASRFLWYLPLAALVSANLWCGVTANYAPLGMVCCLTSMLCVGFLEEVIFRGLLFRAIEKDNVKTAIIISSVTFGIGHILNLINGSGASLLDNLCQVVGAIAIGFLFVMIFYRGGSLIPCIIAHSGINMASAFANSAGVPMETQMLLFAVRMVIIVGYTLILLKTLPKKRAATPDQEAKTA